MNQTSTKTQKVAVVTGASSGIGYAVTKELANKGYKVYACARRTASIEPLVEQFSSDIIIPYQLDITQEFEIQGLKRKLASELPHSKLDLLYNNAGQSIILPALDTSNEMLEKIFKVNVFGHINMTRELSQLLINAHGTIVFTGSLAGESIAPFSSTYSASKAAIHQYARVLHLEMKPFNVRVINALTGAVDTPIKSKEPLPQSSLYNFKEGIESFDCMQQMPKSSNPMSADVYARKLVNDIMSEKDPVDVYRGTFASIMSWLMVLLPYSLLEWGLCKKFKLDKANKILRRKYD